VKKVFFTLRNRGKIGMQANQCNYSVHKCRNIYQIQVTSHYKKLTRSLKTKNRREAESRARLLFPLLCELFDKSDELSLKELSGIWLGEDHNWSPTTKSKYTYYIDRYLKGTPLPTNSNTRSMHVRCINACWNWGTQRGLITNPPKIKDTGGLPRDIILTTPEIINPFKPDKFKHFCVVLLESGVRVKELRDWKMNEQNIGKKWIRVKAKGKGMRTVKLTDRAMDSIQSFDYSRRMCTYWWRKNYKGEVQLRDLRRTFAVDLYRKGVPLLSISRLMGHSSLSMTEWYLQPFTVDEIEI